jgi:mono/diheme cytochrome c family protein
MKVNRIKNLMILIFSFFLLGFGIFQTKTMVQAKADVAEEYKAKCSICHSPKAEKFFDPTKSVDVLKDIILKGNKTSKPPMPEFQSKGMSDDQAKSLVEYMFSLRKPAASNTVNTQADINTNTNLTNTNTVTVPKIDEQTIAFYKANCLMCHTAKAEKSFDPSKADSDYIQTILKGKKTDQPPLMPAFEDKINPEQAKALAVYMRKLRICDSCSNSVNTTPKFDEQLIASYKTKCSMCHSPKAEKSFDINKTDAVLVEIVLKGNKTSKPPMPGFEEKGMKADEAKTFVAYMRSLRN